MKKMTSVLLALVMIFALAIPAFAEDPAPAPSNQKSVDVGGEAVAPTITVTMPTGVVLGLNPYKMKYAGATAFLKNEKGKQDQILSPMAVIENKSDVKLSVNATVTATASTEDITFVQTANDAATSASNDAKTVFLTVQIAEAKDKTGSGWKSDTAPTAAVLTADGEAFYGNDGTSDIAADAADTGKMKAIEIDATDGKVANYIGFKFAGAAAEAPETPWDSNDKIDVAVVFTFNPVVLTVAQQQNNNG